jgi:hypothetical protein
MCILEVSWFTFSTLRTGYPHDKPQLDLKIGNIKQIFNSIRYNRAYLLKSLAKKIPNKDTYYVDWWDGDPNKAENIFEPSKFNINEMYKIFPKLEAGVNKNLLKCYEDIIKTCEKNNIELVLYTAPEAPVYTNNQKDRKEVKDIILKSAKEHDLVYLDFTEGGKFYSSQLDGMLYDSHHVRKADDFTKLFIATLKNKTKLSRRLNALSA